jgi:murein DD-endopeptidase MepM/ murein hydrolase activator NlpD
MRIGTITHRKHPYFYLLLSVTMLLLSLSSCGVEETVEEPIVYPPALAVSGTSTSTNHFKVETTVTFPYSDRLDEIPCKTSCTISSEKDGTVYLDESKEAYANVWEVKAKAETVLVHVTATTENGEEVTKDITIKNTPPKPKEEPKEEPKEVASSEFIWPVEPQYHPLAHDYYLVNTGSKKVMGYTHNNGKKRIEHYVYITGRVHSGFDVTTAEKTKILAPADGVVYKATYGASDASKTSDYGYYMVLKHTGTKYAKEVYTTYGHLTEFKKKPGEKVKQGEVIALSGNTGGSRIPHLHFEVRLGAYAHTANVDPLEILPKRDLDSLPELSAKTGIPASSLELYQAMRKSDWKYPVYVKSAKDITLGTKEKDSEEKLILPKGTVVPLVKRTNSNTTIKYKSKNYTLKINDFIYTY